MKKWEKWESDLLMMYERQGTTVRTISSLLNRSEEEVQKKLEELK